MHITLAQPFLIFLACIGLLCATIPSRAAPATDFSVATPAGAFDLTPWRGHVVYLDFWASWCAPCAQSFPWMNTLQQRYSDQGLRIIAMNVDKKRGDAEDFLRQRPAQFIIGFDPHGALAQAYEVRGMPTSYVIDRQGVVRYRHEGFFTKDAAQIEREIKKLLADRH